MQMRPSAKATTFTTAFTLVSRAVAQLQPIRASETQQCAAQRGRNNDGKTATHRANSHAACRRHRWRVRRNIFRRSNLSRGHALGRSGKSLPGQGSVHSRPPATPTRSITAGNNSLLLVPLMRSLAVWLLRNRRSAMDRHHGRGCSFPWKGSRP